MLARREPNSLPIYSKPTHAIVYIGEAPTTLSVGKGKP